jgi:acetolactate synthase-1/2/3 large subunit
VKILVINNQYLGMVRQWQDLFCQERYSETYLGRVPDLVKLADAYGIYGTRLEAGSDVPGVLAEAVKQEGPCLIDARVDSLENVYPMVPPGAANRDMILSPPVAAKV